MGTCSWCRRLHLHDDGLPLQHAACSSRRTHQMQRIFWTAARTQAQGLPGGGCCRGGRGAAPEALTLTPDSSDTVNQTVRSIETLHPAHRGRGSRSFQTAGSKRHAEMPKSRPCFIFLFLIYFPFRPGRLAARSALRICERERERQQDGNRWIWNSRSCSPGD